MNKEKALKRIADEIARCTLCKKGGTGKAVPGEGNPDARVVFIGEAPGSEEARSGRPFVGRSGKFLRQMIKEAGLCENRVFITSPVHYLPLRGTPAKEVIIHGRKHLFKQLSVIDPEIIVLLGKTACLALLDTKVEITRAHGRTIREEGRTYYVTFHPAYAMRFPEGKKQFIRDFRKLTRMIKPSPS
ncbi:MAG TPA: uracil-DNA glycosylase [Nitrospirota bacterium]|nr:uracil-DNA glycosylase [Nitrospirota bacterium]